MKAIEKQLEEIKRHFTKDHDAKAAKRKLKAIPAKIKKAAASMKKHSEHGKMWEVHEHTLQRKLQEVQDFISANPNASKTTKQVAQSKVKSASKKDNKNMKKDAMNDVQIQGTSYLAEKWEQQN